MTAESNQPGVGHDALPHNQERSLPMEEQKVPALGAVGRLIDGAKRFVTKVINTGAVGCQGTVSEIDEPTKQEVPMTKETSKTNKTIDAIKNSATEAFNAINPLLDKGAKVVANGINNIKESFRKEEVGLPQNVIDETFETGMKQKKEKTMKKTELIAKVAELEAEIETLKANQPKIKAEYVKADEKAPSSVAGSIVVQVPFLEGSSLVFRRTHFKDGGFGGITRIHIENKELLDSRCEKVMQRGAVAWTDSKIQKSFQWKNSVTNYRGSSVSGASEDISL